MVGYIGFSMSRNAADARDRGLRPISEWSKGLILDTIMEAIEDEELTLQFDVELLRKVKLADLKREFLVNMEWHHTSKFYNQTNFYGIDFAYLEYLEEEDVLKLLTR